MTAKDPETQLRAAADAIREAEALLVTAGAGMGVDSGLPDFRGKEGFWKAYPPIAKLGYSFQEMANPTWFRRDPALAWGFYGHRLHLYRTVAPHSGFGVLLRLGKRMPGGAFVYTSNVDEQFEKAGFDPDRILECCGTIHQLQCARPCCDALWSAAQTNLRVDESTMRAAPPLPECPHCGGVARPNILMFGDFAWVDSRADAQTARFHTWLEQSAGKRVVVIECGAGKAVPMVRPVSEQVARLAGNRLTRINVREPDGPPGTISVSLGAREALETLESMVNE